MGSTHSFLDSKIIRKNGLRKWEFKSKEKRFLILLELMMTGH